MEIGSVLRESRINAKMSVKQISDILTEQGCKASEKTVYSWENGNSRPSVEILMKLCDIYGIKDILKTFGYNGYKEDGSIQLTMKEIDMIERYRSIAKHSPKGAKIVDIILDREYYIADQMKRITDLRAAIPQEDIQNSNVRLINYYYRLAELLSLNPGFKNIPLTEDSKCMGKVIDKIPHGENIMDDENF